VYAILLGCSPQTGNPIPQCVPNLNTNCAATYDPPTYQTIFDRILHPTCAAGIGTCHTADAAKGGLVFADADTAYALLLGTVGGRARVLPGDAHCSLIVERLASSDPSFHMPPGPNSIPPGDQCTIVRWIQAGAQR
jgi:hypothetical protein